MMYAAVKVAPAARSPASRRGGRGEPTSTGQQQVCFTPQSYPKNFIHVPLLSTVGHYFEHLCTIFCSVLLDMIYYSTTPAIKTFSCEQRMQIDSLVHVCAHRLHVCNVFFMLSQNDLHPFSIPTPPKLSVTL